MYEHVLDIRKKGKPLEEAEKAAIMIHGRGADAADIMSLSQYLVLENMAIWAPQATRHSWYPYSFMAPRQNNEPALSSALSLIDNMVAEIIGSGMPKEKIFLLGFSQGACLSLEYAARNGARYGGVIAFSGGLIGEELDLNAYQGQFEDTPVFLGCSDRDPHIPLSRVNESSEVFRKMGAKVNEQIYPGMPHTILQEEIDIANHILSGA